MQILTFQRKKSEQKWNLSNKSKNINETFVWFLNFYENILHNEQVDSARIMDRKLTDQSCFNLRVLSLSETHIFLEI